MQRLRFLLVLALFVTAFALQTISAQAFPVTGWTRYYEGIEYATGTATSPRLMKAFALRISVKNPEVGLYASHDNGGSPYEVALQTTPAFLSEHGLKAAVNACFFDPGLSPNTNIWDSLISNGTVVSGPDPSPFNSQLCFTSDKTASLIVSDSIPGGQYTAVGGAEILLSNGAIVVGPGAINPHTFMGLSQDKKYLIMVCVDGRQSGWSDGCNFTEAAQWLLDFGAWDGVMMDGGGSTCMSISGLGSYMNRPCYGYARSIGASLGVTSIAPVAVGPDSVSWDANRVDVIARGAGNSICQKSWTAAAGWTGWTNLGGGTLSAPACSSWGANRLDLFCRGMNNHLFKRSFDGSWDPGWSDLGGTLTSGPAAVSWGPNRIDVIARTTDNSIIQNAWTGSSWSGWVNLGGNSTSNPAICSWESNRLDCFYKGTDNAIWHKAWGEGGWTSWTSIGGGLSSEPAAVSWGPDRIDVVARGTDNAIWQKSWTTSGWSGWVSLGGVSASAPSISSRGSNLLDVFYRGTDDHLYQKSWGTGGWSGWLDKGPYYQ